MTSLLIRAAIKLRYDLKGQDLVEYALIGGFVAVAGGAIFPTSLMPGVSTIFSKIVDYASQAASQGS